jgi:hypothetical protein
VQRAAAALLADDRPPAYFDGFRMVRATPFPTGCISGVRLAIAPERRAALGGVAYVRLVMRFRDTGFEVTVAAYGADDLLITFVKVPALRAFRRHRHTPAAVGALLPEWADWSQLTRDVWAELAALALLLFADRVSFDAGLPVTGVRAADLRRTLGPSVPFAVHLSPRQRERTNASDLCSALQVLTTLDEQLAFCAFDDGDADLGFNRRGGPDADDGGGGAN